MKRLLLPLFFVAGGLVASVFATETLNIGGEVFYSYWRIVDEGNNEARPLANCNNAVYLFKRTAGGDWELFTDVDDNPVDTGSDGNYLFENVNVDPSDEDSLFENADFFMVKTDFNGAVEDWADNDIRARYSYKEPRDSGWSDPDIIRVDVVYTDNKATPPTGMPGPKRCFQGRFVRFIEGTGYLLNMATWVGMPGYAGHEVICAGNSLGFYGCNEGDWWSHNTQDAAATLDEAGWAHFEFYEDDGGYPNKKKYAEYYFYWAPD